MSGGLGGAGGGAEGAVGDDGAVLSEDDDLGDAAVEM